MVARRGGPDEIARMAAPRVFIVTNDFPPRIGGINDYVHQLVRRLPAGLMRMRRFPR